jgi:hypothetical protein
MGIGCFVAVEANDDLCESGKGEQLNTVMLSSKANACVFVF